MRQRCKVNVVLPHQVLVSGQPIEKVIVGGPLSGSSMQGGSLVNALRLRFEAIGTGVSFVTLDFTA